MTAKIDTPNVPEADAVRQRISETMAKMVDGLKLKGVTISEPTIGYVLDRNSMTVAQHADGVLTFNTSRFEGMSNAQIDQIVEHEIMHDLAGKLPRGELFTTIPPEYARAVIGKA